MYQEITIQFTENCNLQCPYCFAQKCKDAFLSKNDFIQFEKFCIKNNIDCIHITGGEPLLHPDFSEMTEKLALIAPLVIYSNLTIPEKINKLSIKNPQDIFILANYNDKKVYTEEQLFAFHQNIKLAKEIGFKIALGITVYKLPFKEKFKDSIDFIKKHKITHFRISQALKSCTGMQGLNKEDIESLYSFVAAHIQEWKSDGIKAYFDCPIPPCYINPNTFNTLRKYEAVGITCKPKAFVRYNLGITHCYSTISNKDPMTLSNFKDIADIKNYSATLLKSIYLSRDTQQCVQCKINSEQLPCGCPVYKI